METSLLQTKLFIPPARPGIVARPRLLERLRSAINCSLILVSAPAGSGKTTLVSDWTRETNKHCRCAWVSLDEGDNDPVRFWDYFIGAIRTLQPSAGENALTLLHSPQPYPTEAMLTAIINDLTDAADDFAVVLDDYHLIKSEPIQAGIAFLLEHLPPKMHLVIATRIDPALPLPHLRGRGTMLEIGADDLRFTIPETAGLFKEMQNLELSAEDVSALNDRTEGWAVGLTMAAISLSKQKDIPGFIANFTGSQRYVMDYLIEEVLGQQSNEVQEFFLKTSILDRLTAPLCDSLTQRSGGQKMLVTLEQANLFLIPLDESRQWYRYHHLFADLLRHQLEAKYGAAEATALHKQSSQWYEDKGFPADAVHHALLARDWERAMTLISNTTDSLTRRGEWKTLMDWFQMLPEKTLRTQPTAYSHYANVMTLHGQLDAAEAVVRHLERIAQDVPGLQGELAFFQAVLSYRRSDDDARIEQFEKRALELLPPDNFAMRARANFQLGHVQWKRARLDEARLLYTEAFELGRQAADYWIAAGAAGYLASILWLRGRLREALTAAQHSVDLGGHSPAAAVPR